MWKSDSAHGGGEVSCRDSRRCSSNKIVIDARLSDLANYYSYVIRHAEVLSVMGFDSKFRSAIAGLPDQAFVMDFIVAVGQNRGWTVQRFYDLDQALQWLAEA